MKKLKGLLIPVLSLILGVATGCSGEEPLKYEEGKTPITDALKFAQADQLDGKRFAYKDGESESEHMGYVALSNVLSGDKATFVQKDYVDEVGSYIPINLRFLCVKTPEFSEHIEPFGKKAFEFTKDVLEAAQTAADEATAKDASGKIHHNIALINNPKSKGGSFEEKNSYGNFWLGFVWYRQNEKSDWRLLNLELVERAYSRNQMIDDDPLCNYRSQFVEAERLAQAGKARIWGELNFPISCIKTY